MDYKDIIKRDISIIKQQDNITPFSACVSFSCMPAQRYLKYIFDKYSIIQKQTSFEELKKNLIRLQKRAFKFNIHLTPPITAAITIYYSTKFTQISCADICKITSGTIRSYATKLKIKHKYNRYHWYKDRITLK